MTTRRTWKLRALALAALVMVVGLAAAPAGAGQKLDDERSPKVKVVGAKLKASDKAGTAKDPAIGKTAPDLTGLSLDGEKVTLTNNGKPRIMLFLSHSCPHCQAEVPVIVELANEGKLDGVEVQTITTNTTTELPNWPPSEWLAEEDWPYSPVLADDAKLRAFAAYGGLSFPYFVLVDADGKVVARASGEIPKETIAEAAKRLAAGESVFEQSKKG